MAVWLKFCSGRTDPRLFAATRAGRELQDAAFDAETNQVRKGLKPLGVELGMRVEG